MPGDWNGILGMAATCDLIGANHAAALPQAALGSGRKAGLGRPLMLPVARQRRADQAYAPAAPVFGAFQSWNGACGAVRRYMQE